MKLQSQNTSEHIGLIRTLVEQLQALLADSDNAKLKNCSLKDTYISNKVISLSKRLSQEIDQSSIDIPQPETVLTTQQAADMLQVSRPFVVKLLNEGVIPYHTVGTHKRVQRADVLRYAEQRKANRLKFLAELSNRDQQYGFYDTSTPTD